MYNLEVVWRQDKEGSGRVFCPEGVSGLQPGVSTPGKTQPNGSP